MKSLNQYWNSILERKNEKNVLDSLNSLRAVFAILIVLGHSSMRFENELLPLLIIHKANYIWVCFFFFISGWSMAYNYDNNSVYLNGFLYRKTIRLCLLAFEAELFSRILYKVLLKQSLSPSIEWIVNWNWYIYEMLVFYFLFWLIYKYISGEKRKLVLLFILVAVNTIILWLMYLYGRWDGWTYAYYFSSFSFPFGIAMHKLIEKKNMLLSIKHIMAGIIILLLSSICIRMPKEDFCGGVVLHNLCGICCMLLIVVICYIADISKVYILRLLSKISAFIYLYQFCMLKIMLAYNENVTLMYVLEVFVGTILLATFIYGLNKQIKRLIGFLGEKTNE